MYSWSNLSENLKSEPAVSGLATLITGLAETYTGEDLNLSHLHGFSNEMLWTSVPSY